MRNQVSVSVCHGPRGIRLVRNDAARGPRNEGDDDLFAQSGRSEQNSVGELQLDLHRSGGWPHFLDDPAILDLRWSRTMGDMLDGL